jgi:hypothetical protein
MTPTRYESDYSWIQIPGVVEHGRWCTGVARAP